jgi:transcriptional regulator with XRE-family HTH domain
MLRTWRKRRKVAQAELAERVGISGKHLSFLETGRARPSREMVDWLGQALDLSSDEKVRLEEAAGFAGGYVPLEPEGAAGERGAQGVGPHADLRATVEALSEPALVHDRFGTIHLFNRAFAELAAPFVDLSALEGPSSGHALLAAIAPHIANWPTLAWFYRQRVEAEILRGQTVDRDLVALLDTLAAASDAPSSLRAGPVPFWVPLEVRLPGGEVRAYRLTTMTFGAPHDVAWRDARLAMLLAVPPA